MAQAVQPLKGFRGDGMDVVIPQTQVLKVLWNRAIVKEKKFSPNIDYLFLDKVLIYVRDEMLVSRILKTRF